MGHRGVGVRGTLGRADRGTRQRGSVTAEFALALPAVVLLLVFALALLSGGVTQARAAAAARAGARAAAIGASPHEVRAVAEQLAGSGARVGVEMGEFVVVHVAVPLPLLGRWGAFEARGEATAVPEP